MAAAACAPGHSCWGFTALSTLLLVQLVTSSATFPRKILVSSSPVFSKFDEAQKPVRSFLQRLGFSLPDNEIIDLARFRDVVNAFSSSSSASSSSRPRSLGKGDASVGNVSDSHSPRLTEWPVTLKTIARAAAVPEADPTIETLGQSAGYFRLKNTHDTWMFYFFCESRGSKETDPLVLWMTGGPGCSSELALFYENGPWKIADDLSLSWNEFGWDKVANIIYVDQPVNTGFSYSLDPRDIRVNEKGISQDVYEFLLEFLEAHPEFKGREFFVTGESYGGHYVPAVGAHIHESNKEAAPENVINLKGIAIGNGLTNPAIQFAATADFAYEESLISLDDFVQFRKSYAPCGAVIDHCDEGVKGALICASAFFTCTEYFESIFSECGGGNLNVYDIRENCTGPDLCYDFTAIKSFLAQQEVRDALGVGNRKWVSCKMGTYYALMTDYFRNYAPLIPPMLEDGVRVLVYAGAKDFICNWLGNSRWVGALSWSGQQQYLAAPWLPFLVDGAKAGLSTSAGPLTFLKVLDSGHMVPYNQPAAALEMIRKFVQNEAMGELPAAAALTHSTTALR